MSEKERSRPDPRRRLRLLGALGAVLLAASALPAAAQKTDVEIALREKRIDDLSTRGLTLAFVLTLSNPADSPRSLVRYDYRVLVGEGEYLKLETALDEPIVLPARGQTPIALPVKITYEYLFQAVPGLEAADRATCYLAGGMVFQDERRRERRVPLAVSGDFPIYRAVEIVLLPVEAKSLTVGGAEITARFALRNPNGSEVRLERLTGKLEIAGQTVAEGSLASGVEAPKKGDGPFGMPLLLDFFEVGREVYEGLSSPPVAVRLTGEAECAWTWGRFRLPVEVSGRVAVKTAGRPPQNQ